VIYYAALEALRNAARHGPGLAPGRPVSARVRAEWADGLEITIEDDGVGIRSSPAGQSGGREGLLIHSTMMAVVGGSLTVALGPEGSGTVVRLRLPASSIPPGPAA
jgi:signal transduction histidine kinase